MDFKGSVTYLISAPILSGYGTYNYRKITLETARRLLSSGFVSAIDDEITAKILSELLRIHIPVRRTKVSISLGDNAIVFRILKKIPKGEVITTRNLLEIQYELGLLERIESMTAWNRWR